MKNCYKYPESPQKIVKEMIHGYENVDHFRWLEGDEKGITTKKVEAWTTAQNKFTREILDALPGRKILESRILPLLEIGSCSVPNLAGERLFYCKREGSQNQPVNYYADGVWGDEKILIDPNKLDETGLTAIAWVHPTKDGKLVAYGEYKSGDENSTLKIIDLSTGKHLAECISGKVHLIRWLSDNSGFVYSKLADLSNPYSRQICFHILGDDDKNDKVIFEQYKEGPLASTWGPFATLSKDGKWFILGYHTSTRSNDLWIADFAEWRATGKLRLKTISEGESGTFHAEINHDRLYIYTNYEAPNGKIFITAPDKPEKENWQELIKERKDSVIDHWAFTADYLVLSYEKNASSYLEKCDKQGKFLEEIALPGIGSAHFSSNDERNDIFLSYTSFNYPSCIFHLDLDTKERKVWNEKKVPVDLEDIEVFQKWFNSKDGTKVSMFLVHKKGIKFDGQNPTLIYGYGGFGISLTPGFSPIICPWLEDGGIYAMVNLRGGSEYGDQWHSDGMLEKKKKVFEDLEASAEYLINEKVTCSEKLAVMGRSNGGLLTGAALTRRPGLYKAIVCGVPLLDMLRYQDFLMARYWVPEYGSAENPEHFEWLIEYSPYQNIKAGTNYPATFIFSGENDTRVHPMHARKMAAALQSFSAAADKQPILLWIDRDSGHGQGKPLNIRVLEETDQWIFLRWQLGMLKKS